MGFTKSYCTENDGEQGVIDAHVNLITCTVMAVMLVMVSHVINKAR